MAQTHVQHTRLSHPAPSVRDQRQELGERLRAARYAANLTQEDLAGPRFSKSYVSAVERGRMMPSFQALSYLAERLGVSVASLLGEQPLEAPATVEEQVEAPEEALLRQARELVECGSYEEAAHLLQQGLETIQHRSDDLLHGHALSRLLGEMYLTRASISHATQEHTAAERAFQDALRAGEQVADHVWLSQAHAAYADFLAQQQRFQEAYEQLRLAQAP